MFTQETTKNVSSVVQGIVNQALQTMPKANFKFKKPVDDIDKAIQAFLNGAINGKFGRYYIHGDMLVYKIAVSNRVYTGHNWNDQNQTLVKELTEGVKNGSVELIGSELDDIGIGYVKYRTVNANLIAQRIDGATYVGNSSVLSLIGRKVSFGNVSHNRGETEVQQRLSQYIPMVPFSVFKEANLDIKKFRMIQRGKEESIARKIQDGYDKKTRKPKFKVETVHFTGASLFEVDGQQYLFDIDRREVKHKIFNPFLVKLPVKVSTISEAYTSLKPQEVIDAEKKGLKVLRQGEFFFIPVKGSFKPDLTRAEDRMWIKSKYRPMTLRAGNNRPNNATLGVQAKGLVSGKITHSGREHAALILKGWYKAIPNTATESFTLTGDID